MTADSPAAGPAVAVGDPAPAFTLSDSEFREVSLSDIAGAGVIIFFYPAAGTPDCTTEAGEFSAARPTLDTAGYTVIGISPDAPHKLAKFAADSGLDLVLLSDPSRNVLRAYGAFGEKKNYGKVVQGVIRSTFVIGADGRIEQALRNVKATGHVARVLANLGLG